LADIIIRDRKKNIAAEKAASPSMGNIQPESPKMYLDFTNKNTNPFFSNEDSRSTGIVAATKIGLQSHFN